MVLGHEGSLRAFDEGRATLRLDTNELKYVRDLALTLSFLSLSFLIYQIHRLNQMISLVSLPRCIHHMPTTPRHSKCGAWHLGHLRSQGRGEGKGNTLLIVCMTSERSGRRRDRHSHPPAPTHKYSGRTEHVWW